MSQQAPDLRRFLQVIWRHGVLVGIAAAVGLLAGAVFAAFSPVMVTSTALIVLPQSSPSMATAVVIARSDQVLARALPRVSPATSLEGLRGDVQVKSLTRYVVSVSASGRTAAQAEATANAVAASYIGYISSAGSPVGRVPTRMLESATSATGTAPPIQVLAGAVLGVVSGALTGVIAAFSSRRPAHDPLPASWESGA
jgi:capsular polysaccharide biosynthesis protein